MDDEEDMILEWDGMGRGGLGASLNNERMGLSTHLGTLFSFQKGWSALGIRKGGKTVPDYEHGPRSKFLFKHGA